MIYDESQKKILEWFKVNAKNNFDTKQIEEWKRQIVITGGAGTGKSFIVKEIQKILLEAGYYCSLTSMTGKAALRIGGKTLHSFLSPTIIKKGNEDLDQILDFNFTKERFENNEILFVDEASMVNWEIYEELIELKNRLLIVYVGDDKQLEPIDKEAQRYDTYIPSPFIDFIDRSGFMKESNVFVLDNIHRQKDDNDILDVAWNVRNGKKKFIDSNKKYKNVKSLEKNKVIDLFSKISIRDLHNNQIISPFRKDAKNINDSIQNKRYQNNKLGKELFTKKEKVWKNGMYEIVDGSKMRIKDKIIFELNIQYYSEQTPSLNSPLFNGAIGFLTGNSIEAEFKDPSIISRKKDVREICYEVFIPELHKKVMVPLRYLKINSSLAYCITVHKAQGSEWENVVFSYNDYMKKSEFVTNKMKYTAITRAKKLLIFMS